VAAALGVNKQSIDEMINSEAPIGWSHPSVDSVAYLRRKFPYRQGGDKVFCLAVLGMALAARHDLGS
jgi:hypothetical protein